MPEQKPEQKKAHHLRAGALIGVLTALLGFAIAVQVHANSGSDSLDSLREDDLISILDDQDARAVRLREQIAELQDTLGKLTNTGDVAQAAREQAERDEQALGILLGTAAATGPGVTARLADPEHKLKAEDLLDVVQELRGAGAEAITFGGVRVGADTAFTDVDGTVAVDGTPLSAPYTVQAIGDATTLDTALNIPGGIAATVRAAGGDLTVERRTTVTITAVRPLPATDHLTPGGD